jgi:hypothetical protein
LKSFEDDLSRPRVSALRKRGSIPGGRSDRLGRFWLFGPVAGFQPWKLELKSQLQFDGKKGRFEFDFF